MVRILLEQGSTVLTNRFDRGEHTGTLRGVTNLERRRLHTAALGEADRCRAWRSILERLRHRWSLALLGEVGLAIRKALHLHHKPAWGAVDQQLCMVQPLLAQVAQHPLTQLIQSKSGEIRRQFLRADLQKKG